MTWRHLTALGALSVVSIAPVGSSQNTPYVVQLHAVRDGFVPPQDGAPMRSQFMTTESGQRFECFLPPLHAETEDSELLDALAIQESREEQQRAAFLTFGQAAVQRTKPRCVQYKDLENAWLYEICASILVRRVGIEQVEMQVEATGETTDTAKAAVKEAEELGTFVAETSRSALTYDKFVLPEMEERVTNHRKPLFTQTFGGYKHLVQVQFICSATAQDDAVMAVQWSSDSLTASSRDIAAFLVGSRKFCDPQHSDADDNDLFTVRSLLKQLEDAHTCVTRNEGWWTYEFCFGQSLRQYHRDSDGFLTADFSLGLFDDEGNLELEQSGSALVSEYIDATHDISRPAYLELYDHGTVCKGFEDLPPRKTKVFYYCSQGGTSHHILSVKETQTCMYTVKVSSPVLCDHPHFLNDEQKSNQAAEILHCIPAATE